MGQSVLQLAMHPTQEPLECPGWSQNWRLHCSSDLSNWPSSASHEMNLNDIIRIPATEQLSPPCIRHTIFELMYSTPKLNTIHIPTEQWQYLPKLNPSCVPSIVTRLLLRSELPNYIYIPIPKPIFPYAIGFMGGCGLASNVK